MKTLRCSMTAIAISFFVVLGTAETSQAGPITYSFSGVLADCTTLPPLLCGNANQWSGRTVVGQFTTDSALSTLLAASFTLLVPGSDLQWRILFPDPIPNSTTSTVTPTSLSILESLLLPGTTDDFLLDLHFNSPLTSSAGSTLQSGFISRATVPFAAPFVSGTVDVVPEPSSMLLVATGLTGLFFMFGAARRRFGLSGA